MKRNDRDELQDKVLVRGAETMKMRNYKRKAMVLLTLALAWLCALGVSAGEGSNDNSLADLGILTEGAEVFPEFEYGVTEYEVRVPAGTQQIELDPVPSNGNATIADITGTELVDGETTVVITVQAENGEQYPYYLHVTEVGSQLPTPAETEPVPETEPETESEPETEDPRYVKVDRTALEEAENTISALKDETRSYRDRSTMLMRLLYGMIAFSVILLFIVINLLLKKKDLKAELQEYMGYDYAPGPQESYAGGQQGGYAGGQQNSYAQSQQGNYAGGQQGAYAQPQQSYYAEQPQEPQLQVYRPEPPVRRDDPDTVPKPQKAKKKPKKMPEYQQPQPQQREFSRHPQKDEKAEGVEINMIDL